MQKIPVAVMLIGTVFLSITCGHKGHDKKDDITSVLKQYERYVSGMKMDSLLSLFTQDAEMGEEGTALIRGKDSIRSFLSSFTNVKVLNNSNPIDSIVFARDTAVVAGHYSQTALIDNKDTVHVKGSFTAKLLPGGKNTWLIRRMTTRSL